MGIGRGLAALAIAAATAFAGAGARAETLADALVAAYENSGLLDQNRALLRAADEDVAQSVALLRPVLNWSASASASNPRTPGSDTINASIRLTADLLLYDFGATQLAIDAQKEAVLATREELRGVEQDVLLRAVQAYQSVRTQSEFVALRQSNVRLITQELRAAQDRFEVGEVTRTDVSLAEARLASSRSLLASAEGNLAQAMQEYRTAVGRAPGNLDPAAPTAVRRGMDEAAAFAVRNHPSILAQQHSVSAAEIAIRRAEASLRPSLRFSGSATLSDEGQDSEQIGLSISGPISQGGALASQIRQAMARRDAQRAGLHITRLNVEQQVGNAYALLGVAQASRDSSDRQIRAARVAFQGVREEATLGARTTLDVLNAEQELLDAQANLISAQADETNASYAVLAAMGLLTAEHLGLGVQTYDPAAYYNLVHDAPASSSDQGRALDRVLRAIGD